jgi:squalene synthase HpnC
MGQNQRFAPVRRIPVAVGHYENFPVASRLVPARLRPAVVAIYRYARAADDLADEGDAAPADRLAALAGFRAQVDAIAAGVTPADPMFAALAATIREHGLPLAPFYDLLSAFSQDVTTKRYATEDDLLDYCRRSANPVGRLLLALYRADSVANVAASDCICTALQLTNFWQDVAIDSAMGRVYLPQEHLARFGLDDGAITAAVADARWQALMAFETARTRERFERGRPLVRALPWRLGLELAAVIAGGRRILARIDGVHGDVFRRRPNLNLADWARIGVRALLPAPT